MGIKNFIRRGGLWVLGQGVLMLAVVVCGVIWSEQQWGFLLQLCGVLCLVAAVFCGISGAFALGRNLTPFPEPPANAHLVQAGIYGFIRHPLYTAVISGAVGWALLRASWPALIGSLALAIFFDAKARKEERHLRIQFPDYADYERRVRRFIPWVY